MSEVHTIGLDLAKSVFPAYGAGASSEVHFRKRLRRNQIISFLRINRVVCLPWRLVAAPITGGENLPSSATM